jgi:hypothetical protein
MPRIFLGGTRSLVQIGAAMVLADVLQKMGPFHDAHARFLHAVKGDVKTALRIRSAKRDRASSLEASLSFLPSTLQ